MFHMKLFFGRAYFREIGRETTAGSKTRPSRVEAYFREIGRETTAGTTIPVSILAAYFREIGRETTAMGEA